MVYLGTTKGTPTSRRVGDVASLPAHPLKLDISRVNSSKTRDHSGDYHNLLEKYIIYEDLNRPLLAWYGSRGDLPWRSDLSDEQLQAMSESDKAQRAYQVWVSEIMLQQTQVATVIPYYKRWITAFPTVKALSNASIDEVNSLWKGLGYYSRASRLLDGAKTVVDKYNGKLPHQPEELVKQIEGIGPYTAGAIASIAYGVRTPTVDGNIQRVICRFLAIYADMKKKHVLDYIWKRAEDLVPEQRAGHWNQALMDLGATVCTPKNPKCGECPLSSSCLAYAEVRLGASSKAVVDVEDAVSDKASSKSKNKPCSLCLPLDPPSLSREVTLYPLKVVKKKSREEDVSICVTRWRCTADPATTPKVLLIKRPEKGLLAGLDEFPAVVMPNDESTATSRLEASTELLGEVLSCSDDVLAAALSKHKSLGAIKHIYSHINAMFHCNVIDIESEELPRIRSKYKKRAKWIEVEEVDNANISTGHNKVWALVKAGSAPSEATSNGAKGRQGSKKRPATEEKGQMKLSWASKATPASSSPKPASQSAQGGSSGSTAVDLAREPAVGTPSPRKKRRISISSEEG